MASLRASRRSTALKYIKCHEEVSFDLNSTAGGSAFLLPFNFLIDFPPSGAFLIISSRRKPLSLQLISPESKEDLHRDLLIFQSKLPSQGILERNQNQKLSTKLTKKYFLEVLITILTISVSLLTKTALGVEFYQCYIFGLTKS